MWLYWNPILYVIQSLFCNQFVDKGWFGMSQRVDRLKVHKRFGTSPWLTKCNRVVKPEFIVSKWVGVTCLFCLSEKPREETK